MFERPPAYLCIPFKKLMHTIRNIEFVHIGVSSFSGIAKVSTTDVIEVYFIYIYLLNANESLHLL